MADGRKAARNRRFVFSWFDGISAGSPLITLHLRRPLGYAIFGCKPAISQGQILLRFLPFGKVQLQFSSAKRNGFFKFS
jgi:hypothetical protein